MRHFSVAKRIFAVLVLMIASGSASALVLQHNGASFNGNPPFDNAIGGSGDVSVILADASLLNPQLCAVGAQSDNVCLYKGWQPGSLEQIHTTVISDIETPPGTLLFTEYVFNMTGTAWTDYHFQIEGATGGQVLGSGIYQITDTGAMTGMRPVDTLDHLNDSGAIWSFFDPPLGSTDGTVPLFEVFFVQFELEGIDQSVTIHQNPSIVPVPGTLALLGLGLAGFGWSRRKKA